MHAFFFTNEILKNLEEVINPEKELPPSHPPVHRPPPESEGRPFRHTAVILISGKRCSGKDTFANILRSGISGTEPEIPKNSGTEPEIIPKNSGTEPEIHENPEFQIETEILHFADELKRMFCESAHLDFHRLMNDRSYKEQNRDKLTEFYHKQNREKISFCGQIANRIKQAVILGFQKKKIFIIPDLRHRMEIQCFRELRRELPSVKVVLVRVHVTDQARSQRGWTRSSIDDDPTETDLDDWDDWDFRFDNNKPGLEMAQKFIKSQLIPFLNAIL